MLSFSVKLLEISDLVETNKYREAKYFKVNLIITMGTWKIQLMHDLSELCRCLTYALGLFLWWFLLN